MPVTPTSSAVRCKSEHDHDDDTEDEKENEHGSLDDSEVTSQTANASNQADPKMNTKPLVGEVPKGKRRRVD